jgi:ribosome recycling factor
MIDDWLKDAEERMEKSVEALHKELAGIRTGRATPALVERLQVDYYGAPTPLQSLASISAPEARLLVIQPYDRSAIGAIEKALQRSELGLNPGNDGQLIRIPVPPLTEERRKDFVKLVKKHAEDARVSVRNIRRDEVDHVRKMEKDGEAGSDEIDRGLAQIQKITDRFVAQIDDVAHRKEQEILEV